MAPMTRRRSARLASNSQPPNGAATAPNLESLSEHQETPVEQQQHNQQRHENGQQQQQQHQQRHQPSAPATTVPRTPASSSPAKPSLSEMHPSKAHMAKEPPSSALRLGFADINGAWRGSPTTAKSSRHYTLGNDNNDDDEGDGKTTAAAAVTAGMPSASPFTFRFARQNHSGNGGPRVDRSADAGVASPKAVVKTPGGSGSDGLDLGLSDEARRMMEELRGEALKIRADLEMQRQQDMEREGGDGDGGDGYADGYANDDGTGARRRIAKPKSRANRFSAAHTAVFNKMESIENHPSAFRAARFTPVRSAVTPATAHLASSSQNQTRGLKRTQSKANLDDETPLKPAKSAVAALAPQSATTAMTATTATRKHHNPALGASGQRTHSSDKASAPTPSARKGKLAVADEPPMSAAKRVKQRIGDDASSSRPVSRDGSFLPRAAAATTTTTATTVAPGNETPKANSGLSVTRSHSMASLLTPTKSSLARSLSVKTPGTAAAPPKTPGKTPGRTPLQLFSGFKRPATSNHAHATVPVPATPGVVKPLASRIEAPATDHATNGKVPPAANTAAARSALPVPLASATVSFSKTPTVAPRLDKPLPQFPATTPRRKLVKRVAFSPNTHRAVLSGGATPSLFKSALPRSALKSRLVADVDMVHEEEVLSATGTESPSVRRRRFGGTVFYPDLSRHELLDKHSGNTKAPSPQESPSLADVLSPSAKLAPPPPPPSVPGTFTFRSDKTISFNNTSPTGFGSSPGQASLRQVPPAPLVPVTKMPTIPGSFPEPHARSGMFTTALVATDGPNKENTRPVAINNIPHGIANKKRHRVSEAEEEAEYQAAERAAKKRKNEPVPEGEALLAPRLVGAKGHVGGGTSVRSTPHKQAAGLSAAGGGGSMAKTPGSTTKKRPVLSLSRLNSLARPKLRK